jgi:hypothetical protein
MRLQACMRVGLSTPTRREPHSTGSHALHAGHRFQGIRESLNGPKPLMEKD